MFELPVIRFKLIKIRQVVLHRHSEHVQIRLQLKNSLGRDTQLLSQILVLQRQRCDQTIVLSRRQHTLIVVFGVVGGLGGIALDGRLGFLVRREKLINFAVML